MSSITPRLLSIPEAAEYMGVGYDTMSAWVSSGVVPYVDMPERRKKLIDKQDLDGIIEARKVGPEVGPIDSGPRPKIKGNRGLAKYAKGWHEAR